MIFPILLQKKGKTNKLTLKNHLKIVPTLAIQVENQFKKKSQTPRERDCAVTIERSYRNLKTSNPRFFFFFPVSAAFHLQSHKNNKIPSPKEATGRNR